MVLPFNATTAQPTTSQVGVREGWLPRKGELSQLRSSGIISIKSYHVKNYRNAEHREVFIEQTKSIGYNSKPKWMLLKLYPGECRGHIPDRVVPKGEKFLVERGGSKSVVESI